MPTWTSCCPHCTLSQKPIGNIRQERGCKGGGWEGISPTVRKIRSDSAVWKTSTPSSEISLTAGHSQGQWRKAACMGCEASVRHPDLWERHFQCSNTPSTHTTRSPLAHLSLLKDLAQTPRWFLPWTRGTAQKTHIWREMGVLGRDIHIVLYYQFYFGLLPAGLYALREAH